MSSISRLGVRAWLQENPVCFRNTRRVDTMVAFNAYNQWSENTDYLPIKSPAFGLALKALIPGIMSQQVQENKRRFRVYILPRDYRPPSDDIDDLL